MTGEPLDLTDIEESWRLAARLTHSVRRAAMTVGDVGKLQRATEHIPELLAEVKRLRAAEERIRALAARHQRIAALQTNPERLVMVPAVTVTEDILAALDPTSEDTP